MLRAALIAALIAAPFTLLAETAGLVVFFVALFGLLLAPGFVTSCPYCRKRVKLGASHCHHCRRAVRGA